MSTIRKQEIDHEIFRQYGYGPTAQCAGITEAFLLEIMRHLIDGDEVHLPGFGTFKVSIRKGRSQVTLTKGTFKKGEKAGTTTVSVDRKFYVSFRRAAAFRQMFWDRFGKAKTKK